MVWMREVHLHLIQKFELGEETARVGQRARERAVALCSYLAASFY